MNIKKRWIMVLCCICLACVMSATTIGCSFNSVVDSSNSLNSSSKILQDVTGQYDVSGIATANFNDSVLKVDGAQTTISVIIDLGGNGLYDIYDRTETFSSFATSTRANKYLKTLRAQQESFVSALNKSGIEYTYKCSYTALNNAVAIRINSSDFYKLGAIKGVKHVYRSEVYAAPEAIEAVENFTPVYSTGVYDSSDVKTKGDGVLVAVLDTGLDYTHPAFQTMPTWSTPWTKSKIAGLFGGLNSAQFASSVDDVYVNDKVPYAFDYADDDADVYPSYSNHGTHVAGIIAGVDEDKTVADGSSFIGVAPNAQLAIMKVFTDDFTSKMLGGADTIDILRAIEDCAILGVDVINMSLGSAGGFSDYASDTYVTSVYDKIEEMGVSLIVAAGNEYSSGFGGGNGTNLASNPDSGTVGSPSTYQTSLSVASIEGQKAPYLIGNSGDKETVAFITNSSDGNGNEIDFIDKLYQATNTDKSEKLTLPYVVIGGVGKLMNYSMSIRNQFISRPTIALVKRGDISFADKVQFAKDNGAIAIVIYNNLSGTIRMSLGDVVEPIPACSIGLEAGLNLVNNATNGRGEMTFSADYTAGPFMSDFSSWGPTPSLDLKPEITAYGGKILSAVPGGGYDQLSGTSMAAPNMAGMVALMRQFVYENYGLEKAALNDRAYQMLMSTATLVKNDEGNPYSPRKQGSGLGSLLSAMTTKGYITVEKDGKTLPKTKIELYDDYKRTGEYEMEFTIHNVSDGAISYMPHVYNMTETLAVDGRTVAERAHMLNDTDVKVYVGGTLTDGRVTVPADSSVTVKVTLKLGAEGRKYIEDSFVNGMYVEGFVRFEQGLDADNKEICDLGIPYLAFYGDWSDAPMFDYTLYDVSASENDSSVELEDKIKASAAATTPYGLYEDKYIIPLGSYIYEMEETDVAIDATSAKAAISMFNNDYAPIKAINQLYAIYAGMLRGAKEFEISIVDTVTGELVFSKTTYNQRKSYAGGGSNIGSPVTLDIMPYEWDWRNNNQYELRLSGKLDWHERDENGNFTNELVVPDKNEFVFQFTVDYEAPTITDYRVRFEPYTENKETKYRIYLDVDVFDNQYTMALLPCFIKDNTLYTLTHYPVPVYSQQNQSSTVSFEITDYYEDYFKKGEMYLYPLDYAMNHSLYRVGMEESITYPEQVKFETGAKLAEIGDVDVGSGANKYSYTMYSLSLAPNELFKLVQTALPEGTVAHKLEWTSNNDSVKAYENEIFAGPDEISSPVILTLKANGRIVAGIRLTVKGEAKNAPKLISMSYRPVINGDDYVAAVDSSLKLKDNTTTKLEIETNPWYFADKQVTWTSSNENVAVVDENGVVTTKSPGYAWITATSVAQSNVSAAVRVIVGSDFDVRNYRLYHYYGGEICEIPDELNVMYLDDECFQNNTLVKKVVLPKTLTEIPEKAFVGCTNLEEVVIPASCTAVLNYAFAGCEKLTKITLLEFTNKVDNDKAAGSLTIGLAAFYGCTSLNEIENPLRLTSLGDAAFAECTSLTEIDISGLRVVGAEVFYGCTNLESVTMSNQTKLGHRMFVNCTKLNNVDVKAEILPYGLFAFCTSLSSVTLSSASLKSIGDLAFYGCTALKEITLPNGQYALGYNVFSDCSNLAKVTLSQNTLITNDLTIPFTSCSKLAEIEVAQDSEYYSSIDGILYDKAQTTLLYAPVLATLNEEHIPITVKKLGASAFAGNTQITTVSLSKYDVVGKFALSGTAITNVEIPANWTEIPEGLFYNARSLKTVTFAGGDVEIIGADAFAYCVALDSINLPNSVIEIGESAFEQCSKLTSLNLANVKTFGGFVFAGTGISNINAPNATTLADYAFVDMAKLATVKLGPVTSMGEGLFLISSTTTDGSDTFIGNSTLQTVEFGEGTTKISAYAFYYIGQNDNLTSVVIPNSVTDIGEYAFYYRSKLTSVNLSNVTEIGDCAFMYCTKLNNVDLSKAQSIGFAAFALTSSLTEVDLSSAETIGNSAFEQSGLTSLTLPKAKTIGSYAFATTNITSVTIPASLNTYNYKEVFTIINDAGDNEEIESRRALRLKEGAFMDIPTLTEFKVAAGNEVFFAEDGVLYAKVNEGYVLVQYPAGRTATEYEVKEGTVSIAHSAFYSDKHLTKVTFPVSLKFIGAFAFYGSQVNEFVFKAVEAPTLETEYMNSQSMYSEKDLASRLVFTSYNNTGYGIFSTVYYANFGEFAALVIEEDHVLSNLKWENAPSSITYTAPVFEYKLTRPVNGIGYDTPIWKAYFDTVRYEKDENGKDISIPNTTLSDYAAERVTQAAIDAIKEIEKLGDINARINAIAGKEDKLAELNRISADYLQVARKAYNAIITNEQKALVTDYGKLLAAELTVRNLKADLGSPVALKELNREGYYKTRYEEGEKFDLQGMKIIAIYEDGSLLELTDKDYTLDKTGALKATDTTVTISYGGKSIELGIMVSGKTDDGGNGGNEDPEPKPVNVGLIVGLSVGGAVVLAGVAVLVVLLLRKKKLAVSSVKVDETKPEQTQEVSETQDQQDNQENQDKAE